MATYAQTPIRSALRTGDTTFRQCIILRLQSLQGQSPILAKVGPSIGCYGVREKPRLPFFIILFPSRGFLSLPFFKLCLQLCGFVVLFAFDCLRDRFPEPLRLVRELLFDRGNDFWERKERFEIDEEMRVLIRRKRQSFS